MKKYLPIAVVVLGLVILGEIAYMFFLKPAANKPPSVSKFKQPLPTGNVVTDNFLHDMKADARPVVVSDYSFASGKITSTVFVHGITPYFLVTETTGTIKEISSQPGEVVGKGVRYAKALMLDGVVMGNPMRVLFDESDISYLKVYRQENGVDREIAFEDLKVGDTIFEKERYDLVNKRTFDITITIK